MANITKRISGKYGQIWLQNGTMAVASQVTTKNSVAEIVDGISYDAYSVFTISTTVPPLDEATGALLTWGGGSTPAAWTTEIDWLRGKFITTPAMGSSNTLTLGTIATCIMLPCGDSSDFSIDCKQGTADITSQMQTWEKTVATVRSWSGSATIFYKATDWWLRGPGGNTTEAPTLMRFYPAKGIGTEYWYGTAFVDWGIKVPKGGALEQSVSFKGVGPLLYAAS
jgi:hypothetical protein